MWHEPSLNNGASRCDMHGMCAILVGGLQFAEPRKLFRENIHSWQCSKNKYLENIALYGITVIAGTDLPLC